MRSKLDYSNLFANLGMRSGMCVLLFGEWSRSEDGAAALVSASLQTLGTTGTLAAIAMNSDANPIWHSVNQLEGAIQSRNSGFPVSAFGGNAEFITSNAPLHFPFGSNSPISRLYQLDALTLVFGPDYTGHPAIHLAEVWADVPYSGLSSTISDGDGNMLEIRGSPGCGKGFAKIEKILRQARILREQDIEGVICQAMPVRQLASMAGEMLKGDPSCLLCDNSSCAYCEHARVLTRKQGEPALKRMVDFEELF